MSQSLWLGTQRLPSFPKLEGDVKTDVLIIGGGLCGVLCTYFLKEAGVDCMLVEADVIGSHTTGHTTAKLTSQHGLLYYKLSKCYGCEAASIYLQANEQALAQYEAFARQIDCDFTRRDSFVYSLRDRARIEREVDAVNRLGFPASFAETAPLPFPTVGAVRFPAQAQFHPIKFLAGLAGGLPIYEHTPVQAFAPHQAQTPGGTITADKMILTTHFPFWNRHGSYFLKLYQHRSYVLALQKAPDVSGMYVGADLTDYSFRNYGDLLLLGGGGHRTGKKGGGTIELRRFVNRHYPGAREVCSWAAQDCMSLDGLPYIGQYSANTPDIYTATGFHKWGMIGSMTAAMLLRDLLLGYENPLAAVVSPSRSILHRQLLLNGMETAANLLVPTTKRCPHLGCALKWNPFEHTWDCPCHGSRFTESGTLLDTPAMRNARTR